MVQRLFADVINDAIWFMNIHEQNHPWFLAMYATFAFELFNLFYMGGWGLPRSPKRLARLLFEKSQCFRFEYPIDILVELCLRKIKWMRIVSLARAPRQIIVWKLKCFHVEYPIDILELCLPKITKIVCNWTFAYKGGWGLPRSPLFLPWKITVCIEHINIIKNQLYIYIVLTENFKM